MYEIRFTRHAEEKFEILDTLGIVVSKEQVTATVLYSRRVDSINHTPLHIAQSTLDAKHVLRVVYKIEYDILIVITFYPGRKSKYEK